MGQDANDRLQASGAAGLKLAFVNSEQAGRFSPFSGHLEIGSDNEVAERVGQDLHARYGHAVFAEGEFYVWNDTYWAKLFGHDLY